MKIHEKYFQDISDHELFDVHLTAQDPVITKDYAVISTLAVMQREVASASGYDRSKNILPLMGIMAIIEQLGECYAVSNMPVYSNASASSIKKGLHYFGGILDIKIVDAIYGLRNGIVHNASFYSKSKTSNGKSYVFTYDHNQTAIIKEAITPWDGNFNVINVDHFTTVNPSLLKGLAFSCIESARQQNNQNNLSVILPGGRNELIYRYLKWKLK